MSSPITYLGNGVQTRFEVPGSITKVVQVNGVVVAPASSDFQSVTLSSAPGVGVPVSISYAGVVPLDTGGVLTTAAAAAVQAQFTGGGVTLRAPYPMRKVQRALASVRANTCCNTAEMRSSPMPVSTEGLGKGCITPASSRLNCMNTLFQISM